MNIAILYVTDGVTGNVRQFLESGMRKWKEQQLKYPAVFRSLRNFFCTVLVAFHRANELDA